MVKKENSRFLINEHGERTTPKVGRKPLIVPAVVFEQKNISEAISFKNILIFCRECTRNIRDTNGKDNQSVQYFVECIRRLSKKVTSFSKLLDWDNKRIFQELLEDGKKTQKLLEESFSSKDSTNQSLFSTNLIAGLADFEWRCVQLLEQLRPLKH